MKVFLTAVLLVLVSLVARPAAAATTGPERAGAAAARPAISQLAYYLTAALQLSTTQSAAVRQALKASPLQTRTPEQVIERLRPVLTATEFHRFIELTNDVRSYEYLHYLMMR